MKLVSKLVFGFLSMILIILITDGYISYQSQIALYETDMKNDLATVGRIMKPVIEDLWGKEGKERAITILNDSNHEGTRIHIRFVWLDLAPNDAEGPKISSALRNQIENIGSEIFYGYDNQFVYLYLPLIIEGNRSGAIELSESLSFQSEYRNIAITRLVILTSLLLLISIFVSILMSFKILGHPLNLLVQKIHRIGSGDYSKPLILPGNNELSTVSDSINTMCSKIETSIEELHIETEARINTLNQLRHENRLKTVGRLASGIAHELGTPLNVISGRAVMISRDTSLPESIKDNATIIKNQCDRISIMFRQLLDFARQKPSQKRRSDLKQILIQVLHLMQPMSHKQNIVITLTCEEESAISNVDVEQIKQVIMNLVTNAIQAMPEGGLIKLCIKKMKYKPPTNDKVSPGEYYCISIQDEGTGISDENMSSIFEPFFTTKDTGQGTGLGLSIVHGIIHENNGWIEVESELHIGSCFSLYLPVEN